MPVWWWWTMISNARPGTRLSILFLLWSSRCAFRFGWWDHTWFPPGRLQNVGTHGHSLSMYVNDDIEWCQSSFLHFLSALGLFTWMQTWSILCCYYTVHKALKLQLYSFSSGLTISSFWKKIKNKKLALYYLSIDHWDGEACVVWAKALYSFAKDKFHEILIWIVRPDGCPTDGPGMNVMLFFYFLVIDATERRPMEGDESEIKKNSSA